MENHENLAGTGRHRLDHGEPNIVNATIVSLHQAYTEATSFDLPLNYVFQQVWLVASKEPWCLQPDDVKLVVKERLRGIVRQERRTASIYLRNLIGTLGDQDGPLAEFQMELAAIRARMRKPAYDAGKVLVLKATGRQAEPDSPKTRHISEIFKAL